MAGNWFESITSLGGSLIDNLFNIQTKDPEIKHKDSDNLAESNPTNQAQKDSTSHSQIGRAHV